MASTIASPSLTSQQSLANSFDLVNPPSAVASYSRQMHLFTKRQMDLATQPPRRSAETGDSATTGKIATLRGEDSLDSVNSTNSVNSTDSVESVAEQE